MKNALTIDVEDWYQTQDFNFPLKSWSGIEDRVVGSTETILEILSCYDVKATFFVLGCVAQKYPGLVRKIDALGHEIGSHGAWHQMVSKQSREEFRKDLRTSKDILENITGKAVRLFRAPSWSITRDTLWALQILDEEGFTGDSSIQPFETPLSGIKGAPQVPFHPVIDNHKLKLVEYPPPVLPLGRCILPFAGGFYLRIWPYAFVARALRSVNKARPGMVYVHPWEIDEQQPRVKASPLIRFIHYYNLKTTEQKLKRLLTDFNFVSLGELISEGQFPFLTI